MSSPQLWYSHSHRPNENICNCTMCPQFERFAWHECDVVGGIIREPKISWCRPGIAFIWMATHSADDVVELLGQVQKPL